MTYEEVVEAAIEEGKRKAQEARNAEEESQTEKGLGLWHKICWKVEQCKFAKSELSAYEKHAARLGNNFYRAPLHCPQCSEKLFMVVYPEGEENPVETEEGKVFLAEATPAMSVILSIRRVRETVAGGRCIFAEV